VLPAHETVEGTLEVALHKAGFISDSNFGDFNKVSFSRASRTDKGVHSLATVRAGGCWQCGAAWRAPPPARQPGGARPGLHVPTAASRLCTCSLALNPPARRPPPARPPRRSLP
jgi:hypothetical protein